MIISDELIILKTEEKIAYLLLVSYLFLVSALTLVALNSLERVAFGSLFVTFDIFGEKFTSLIWHRYC